MRRRLSLGKAARKTADVIIRGSIINDHDDRDVGVCWNASSERTV